MVLDPIPQSLPVHFFGSRPQPPTSHPPSPCSHRCLRVASKAPKTNKSRSHKKDAKDADNKEKAKVRKTDPVKGLLNDLKNEYLAVGPVGAIDNGWMKATEEKGGKGGPPPSSLSTSTPVTGGKTKSGDAPGALTAIASGET